MRNQGSVMYLGVGQDCGYLGYICRKARTVANGPSAWLLVQIMRAAMSLSHLLLLLFASCPPVTSRYCAMVRVKDSSIAFPNTAKTSRNTAT
jgi:hypothetical protein